MHKLSTALIAAITLVISSMSYGDTITVDTSKLSSNEKAQLYGIAAKNNGSADVSKSVAAAVPSTESLDRVTSAINSISTVGAGAIVATAKGVGTAASDFAKTPAGTAVVAGAIYHFIGDSVLTQFKQLILLPVVWVIFTAVMAKLFKAMIISGVELSTPREPISVLFGLIKFNRAPFVTYKYIDPHKYDFHHFAVGIVYLIVSIVIIMHII